MKILPVLDLKGGVVVRGVAGRRDEYRPIVSRQCDDPSPASVARGLREAFGFDECYVADLDAIAGGEMNSAAYAAVVAAGMRPWIDAGAVERPPNFLPSFLTFGSCMATTILGLESFPDDRSYLDQIDWDPLTVFSLDLKQGKPLTSVSAWSELSAEEVADQFIERGVRAMMVLDLASVGMGQGVPTLDLCRLLRRKHPQLEIISGGGVRDVSDLHSLREAGCNAALVASALHDGRLTPEMLKTFSPDERT